MEGPGGILRDSQVVELLDKFELFDEVESGLCAAKDSIAARALPQREIQGECICRRSGQSGMLT